MLKLDIDNVRSKDAKKKTITMLFLSRLFFGMPYPYKVRFSSGGEGLHVVNPNLDTDDYRRYMFDDEMRIRLDDFRFKCGIVIRNLLWDKKNGKSAGAWKTIKNEKDAAAFLDFLSGD